MSGGGGGPVIIQNLIDNPGTTAEEKELLEELKQKRLKGIALTRSERIAVKCIVERLLLES